MKQKLTLKENAEAVLLDVIGESSLSKKRILVALSGGADSVSLLLVLTELSGKYGFELLACHVNHMIRGEEADRDERFAEDLCKSLGIPYYCKKEDVPALSKKRKTGLEQTARDVRYEYFDSFIKNDLADLIATAHNAQDNAETVLMNLARGSGSIGLCGIPLSRGNIIRPILYATREEIEDYLKTKEQSYVTDSTNLCDDCSRNVIRHRVIPELKNVNSSFIGSVSGMTQILKRENSFLEKLCEQYFTDDISSLSKLDDVITSRIISKMYRKLTGSGLEMQHTDMLCEKIKEYAASGSGETLIFNLPLSVSAVFTDGKIKMMQTENAKNEAPCSYDITLSFGTNVFPDGKMIAVMETLSDKNVKTKRKLEYNKNVYSLFIDARLFGDIIKGKIQVRSYIEGERFRENGMSKSVRKIYGAKKIRQPERNELPRICDSASGEILYLTHVGACDSQREYCDKANIRITIYKLNTKEQEADK